MGIKVGKSRGNTGKSVSSLSLTELRSLVKSASTRGRDRMKYQKELDKRGR